MSEARAIDEAVDLFDFDGLAASVLLGVIYPGTNRAWQDCR